MNKTILSACIGVLVGLMGLSVEAKPVKMSIKAKDHEAQAKAQEACNAQQGGQGIVSQLRVIKPAGEMHAAVVKERSVVFICSPARRR